ncbi:MAG: PBP1A family penicillin-binding protein [Deltaproteobacteria bacterium]|nr:PBP1A family penicillin-binding protein [Deltaproteobacteria bacterium]
MAWQKGVRIFRFGAFLLVGVLLVAAGGWIWLQRFVLPTLPTDLSKLRDWRPLTSCQVYAADGVQVDEFYVERRVWVPVTELEPSTYMAFVAAEDRRFLEHPGVDWMGIVRAAWVNLRAGTVSQGGSTITQQLVKNLLVGQQRSIERKLKEAILAVRLDRQLTKLEILELYVNYVFLGSGNYGVEAAARDYFGVSARDIDPGQAALLAGLVPAPSRYSPRNHPERARARRAIVLRRMVEDGLLPSDRADSFDDDPVIVPREVPQGDDANAAYLTWVRRGVRELFGAEMPFRAGLQVYTPLDVRVQAVAQEAVQEAVRALEERQGRRGPVQRLGPADWQAFLDRGEGLSHDAASGRLVPPEVGACFPALVGPSGRPDELLASTWRFALEPGECDTRVRTGLSTGEPVPRPLCQGLVPGDILRVCRTTGSRVRLDPRPWGEGAAVVLENATGRVQALVGGYAPTLEGYLRAIQARRQPGSSFKPYVYATALLSGTSQVDVVVDAPLALLGTNGRIWRPRNYNNEFFGRVDLRTALARSLNTVAVRLALAEGPEAVAQTARAMGVATPLRTDLTLALGSSEVTLLDQALGYATIARLGTPVEAVFVDRLADALGDPLASAGEVVHLGPDVTARLPGGPRPRALPTGVAYELIDMMREVVRAGTARKAWKEGFDRAGKTGTTNDFLDAWFVGFTPRYTVGIWIGTDGTLTLGNRETGGRTALPAWMRIVDALDQPAGERFCVPDDVVLVPHETTWIGLRRGRVPRTVLPVPDIGDAPLPLAVFAPVDPDPVADL